MNEQYFAVRYTPDPSRRRVWKAICAYLMPEIPARGTVVELGAGYCDFINQVSAGKKHAVDIHREVQEFCNADVQFHCTAVERMRFRKESIDVFFASNLFEHLDDRKLDTTLGRIMMALKRGGRLILLQPNYRYSYKRYWDDFTHVKAFSHVSLADLLASKGFRVRRVEKRFLPFTFKSSIPKTYGLVRLYLALPWRPFAGQMLVIVEKP